jgi:uncharacterized protein (DUF2252 family)
MVTPVRNATVAERMEIGRAARKVRPRIDIGKYVPAVDRQDPVATLLLQEEQRVVELLPLRHSRMAASPFSYLRGAAAVMAADLGAAPNSGLTVQLSGDAHLSNLGLFAAPDRRLVFDLNDFDETNPGPFEWDVIRLATSFEVAARTAGHSATYSGQLPKIVAEAYRLDMAKFAAMSDLDLWYYRIDTEMLTEWAKQADSKAAVNAVRSTEQNAMARNRWSAVKSLTTAHDGERRFKDKPPLLVSLDADSGSRDVVNQMYETYKESLLIDREALLSRYHWVDAGHKVVGVGSVGLLAFVLLLQGRDSEDLLVLQIKQAVDSVLEPYSGSSAYSSHGERVIAGQRLMQASTDSFLGWVEGPQGRSYYVRQLRDMKWAPDPLGMTQDQYDRFANICGRALARAHARSGDPIALSAYLGSSDRFDKSIAQFSHDYAVQNDEDYQKFVAAIDRGEVTSSAGKDVSTRISLQSDNDGEASIIASGDGADPSRIRERR